MPKAETRPSTTRANPPIATNVIDITGRAQKAPHPYANVIAMDTRRPIHGGIKHASSVRVDHPDRVISLYGEELKTGLRIGRKVTGTAASIARYEAKTLGGVLTKAATLAAISTAASCPLPAAEDKTLEAKLLRGIILDLIAIARVVEARQ